MKEIPRSARNDDSLCPAEWTQMAWNNDSFRHAERSEASRNDIEGHSERSARTQAGPLSRKESLALQNIYKLTKRCTAK